MKGALTGGMGVPGRSCAGWESRSLPDSRLWQGILASEVRGVWGYTGGAGCRRVQVPDGRGGWRRGQSQLRGLWWQDRKAATELCRQEPMKVPQQGRNEVRAEG